MHTLHCRSVLLMPLLAGACAGPPSRDPRPLGPPREPLREITPLALEPAPAPDAEAPDAARARFADLAEVQLSLEECRASALANNLDLRVSLIDPTIANESITDAESRFTSSFNLRGLWSRTDTPTASSLVDAQSEALLLEPSVEIPLRTGGTASVSLPLSRSRTNNAFATLDDSYTSDLAFSFSQPLLKNAGRFVSTAGIRIARLDLGASEARARLAVIGLVSSVDRLYWRLVQARRELEVRQQQYELAQVQLQRAERQLNAGAVAEIEVVRAQAGLAERLEAIILAQNDVLAQQRELKRVIHAPGLELDATTMVVPATPPDPVRYAFDRATLAGDAIAQRAELLELEYQLLADATRIDVARNDLLPTLSADASYRVNGLGATMSESSRILRENNFEDWSLGLSASVPLDNGGPRARLRQSLLARMQRIVTRDSRQQTVRQEVYDAADRIDAGWQRLIAARQSVLLNARAFQAEQRQFDVGRSTSTDVLDAAARLADAQSAEIRAIVDYQIAQIDLAQASGTLLGAARIRWEPTPTPDLGSPPTP